MDIGARSTRKKCQETCRKIKMWYPLKAGMYAIRDYEFIKCIRACATVKITPKNNLSHLKL
jgi:hypothetical protein